MQIVDQSGKTFGDLSVTGKKPRKIGSRWAWLCHCSCGVDKWVSSNVLQQGHARSCGCKAGNKVHGHTWEGGHSPTYSSWANMISRCTQPSNPAYAHYKKLGITVCRRWRKFENFLTDMGERPGGKREYTLERINNKKGYTPSNCRWATWREQGNNRSTNSLFVYKGKRYTLAELSRHTGVSKDTLRARIGSKSKLPWTVEGAVHTPKLTRSNQGFYC